METGCYEDVKTDHVTKFFRKPPMTETEIWQIFSLLKTLRCQKGRLISEHVAQLVRASTAERHSYPTHYLLSVTLSCSQEDRSIILSTHSPHSSIAYIYVGG